jgi:hypothetical protein
MTWFGTSILIWGYNGVLEFIECYQIQIPIRDKLDEEEFSDVIGVYVF